MNVVILQGNLTNDPELRYITTSSSKQVAVCNFGLAVNRHYKKANGEKHKETTFIDCEIWDTGAETLAKYMSKGRQVLVRGSLKNDTWEKDGQRISKMKLRIEEFEMSRKPSPTSDTSDDDNTPTETADGNDIPF